MIITYLRSSSYTTEDWCPNKYFIGYVLGQKEKSNRKADLGNICHLTLELWGKKKLALDRSDSHVDDDRVGRVAVADLTLRYALDLSFALYVKDCPAHAFAKKDYDDCWKWTLAVLEYQDHTYDPIRSEIVNVEQTFDFQIDQPWAKYSYKMPSGELIEGNLRVKGSIDFVRKVDGLFEVIDYKTGKRMDWATGEEKTYAKLRKDPQLRMYHYAIAKLFPECKGRVIVTIFYINAGGPFSIVFEESDLAHTEKMLKAKFERIKNTEQPKLKVTWKCDKLCTFSKPYEEGSDKSTCHHFRDEVRLKGVNRVTELYSIDRAYMRYGDGGGQKENKI